MVEPLPTPQPSITVSIVVPVFSGEAFLRELTGEVERLRQRWIEAGALLAVGELIFVDDAAVDRSPELLDQIAEEKSWVRVVHLSRNFGTHAATDAGILYSSGDWVVTLDEDLQHPPAAIPAMLRKAAETRCDIVYANPEGEVHERAWRDVSSRSIKRIIKWLTGNPHILNVNSFRLIRGPVARSASSLASHDTYFDIALSWFTQRVEVVRMNLKDRRFIDTGKSGFTFRSLLSHARRLLISSQLKVLRLGALLGFFFVLMSIMGGILLILVKLLAPQSFAPHGWASMMVTIVLLGGLILLLLGILLEYTSSLVLRAHGKPLFFVIDRRSDAALARALELTEQHKDRVA